MLALSLTRSWVSEQNLNFVLPLVLLCSTIVQWPMKWVTATWILPFVFSLFHSPPSGMLFLVMSKQFIDMIELNVSSVLMTTTYGFLTQDNYAALLDMILTAWIMVGIALLMKSIRGISPGSSGPAVRISVDVATS